MLFEGGADVIPYALEGEIVIFIVITYQIVNSLDISVGAVTGYRVLAGAADVVYPAELLALVYV